MLGFSTVLRIATAVVVGLMIFAAIYFAAMKVKEILEDEEADNVGALIVVLIVIVGSITGYFVITELL